MSFPDDRVWVQITIASRDLSPEQINDAVGTTFDEFGPSGW